jgi:hypothetical protein
MQLFAVDVLRDRLRDECAGAAAVRNQQGFDATRTASSMKSLINLGIRLGWVLLAAIAILTLALRLSARDPIRHSVPGSHPADRATSLTARGASVPSALNDRFVIKRYALDFDGDHSLDMATVIERVSGGYATYTVQLHLASGADQSVVVAAPPGGLQIEMHDLTGDKIPNDVVLRPALLRWLPTVLVNDGHDHFAVAVSGTSPSSFSSRENLDSKRRDVQVFALLSAFGFKAVPLPGGAGFVYPQFQQVLLDSCTQTVARRLGQASSPGRAPPFPTQI